MPAPRTPSKLTADHEHLIRNIVVRYHPADCYCQTCCLLDALTAERVERMRGALQQRVPFMGDGR